LTCYFRHMKDIFNKAGVEVTKENRKDIDRKTHSIVGVEYKNCSATWREVKKRIAEDEEAFITMLKEALN
jgi:molecular chaperone GrpE (heat shock protein)